jgi:hypothetical protein
MAESVSTSATFTASGNFVYSVFGPASSSAHVSSVGALALDEEGGGGGPAFPATGQQWPIYTEAIG